MDAHVEEVQRLWAENQKLKARVGVLGDQLSSALEGALESWDDVERVQQEACGFALGAGMEVGALEAALHGVWLPFSVREGLQDPKEYARRSDEFLAGLQKQRDAALARAEAAEADAHQQRVERDAMFDTAESALARVERLKVELFEARAERDGLRAALQVGLDQAYRVEQLEKALEATVSAWTHEAGQGDGIMEEHGSVLDEARAALREGKP